jgi:DNA-binding protein HU-beta
MNKTDLISKVASKTSLTKTKTSEVIEAVLESIKESLINGEKVSIVGFGTFGTTKRKARVGLNPKNQTKINIPAKTVARFKVGTALSESINK